MNFRANYNELKYVLVIFRTWTCENFDKRFDALQQTHSSAFRGWLQTKLRSDESKMRFIDTWVSKQSTHLQLNSEFLWYQRILALTLNNNDRENAKKDLIDTFKKYFDGNWRKEEKLKIFENT